MHQTGKSGSSATRVGLIFAGVGILVSLLTTLILPRYEYECHACKARHEFLQSFSEGAKRKCPSCGKLRLKKMISGGVGLIFKGEGFYVNDYPKDKS
jgi:putative FmdB family regulatory protein